jgi:hypothetical protein
MPEKGPGSASVATRTPFDNVETWSNSTGSYTRQIMHEPQTRGSDHTLCPASTTVARPLEPFPFAEVEDKARLLILDTPLLVDASARIVVGCIAVCQ